MDPDVLGAGQVLQRLIQDAGIVFDGAFQVLDGHFPGRILWRYTVHRDVVVAAGEQNQFCGGAIVGLGEVTVIFKKTMYANHGVRCCATVISNRHRTPAHAVNPAGKHFGIGAFDRFDQLANMTGFHDSSPSGRFSLCYWFC